VQAISELFNRPIEVYVPGNGSTPLNIFHAEYKTQDAPIRLSYHDGNHYNAVIDPIVPTAGLGLGLPGLQSGLADKMQSTYTLGFCRVTLFFVADIFALFDVIQWPRLWLNLTAWQISQHLNEP